MLAYWNDESDHLRRIFVKLRAMDIYLGIFGFLMMMLVVFSYANTGGSTTFAAGSKWVYQILRAYALFGGIYLCFTKVGINWRTAIIYSILLPIAYLSNKLTGSSSIFLLIVLMFGLRGISFRSIVKMYGWSIGIGTLVIVVGALLGVFGTISYQTTTTVMKESFGFVLPNTAGIFFFEIIIILLYLFNKKYAVIQLSVVVVCGFLLYLTHARTSFLVLVVALIIFGVQFSSKGRLFFTENLTKIVMTTLILCILFSVLSILLYSMFPNSIMAKLNSLMSGRLELGAFFLKNYGFSALGQHVQYNASNDSGGTTWWHTVPYTWLDNSYLKLLINYGYVWLVLFVAGIYIELKKAEQVMDSKLAILMISIFIIGIGESTMLSCWFNIILFGINASFEKDKLKC